MAVSSLAASLPKFILIKSSFYIDKGIASFVEKGGRVLLGKDEGVFSTLVKIEVETAKSNNKYVNLRFCYSNKFWQESETDNYIVTESDQPEEDTSKPSCTLFEAIKRDGEGVFDLIHVHSGGTVMIDGLTGAVYVDERPIVHEEGNLTFIDWESLVKLPANVAFQGDNSNYLFSNSELVFWSTDPNDERSGFTVEQAADGYVRLYSVHDKQHCYVTGDGSVWANWEASHSTDASLANFWPVKIDDKTIALRNQNNNNFCSRYNEDYLYAKVPTITKEARLGLQELVLGRKITNVVYQMEYARIFDEMPYVAGRTSLDNTEDVEASMEAIIQYTDEKSYSFTSSVSMSAGVSSTIEAGLPFITSASITVSYEISGTFEWNTTTTDTVSLSATGSVPVPARTSATIEYVATKGTCNIPYAYTQQDKSSTDGSTSYVDLVDGIYTGVSCYNFSFVVRDTTPL